MKKLYFLLLMCFISVASYAQQTVVIYDTAALSTYKSGHASLTFRFDDTIKVGESPDLFRGYAVFDLATVPPNAAVTYVEFGYYLIDSSVAATVYGPWQTYGIPMDLAGVTSPPSLLAAMTSGAPLWNNSYSTGSSGSNSLGNRTFTGTTSSPPALFIQGQAGNKVSISLTGGSAVTYSIMGESGFKSMTAPFHCPYLKVTYTCALLGAVSATGTPGTLCEFTPLTLTGFASGASSYSWLGPNGFNATGNPASAIADTTGKYLLIARNGAGCFYSDSSNLITVYDAPPAEITTVTDTTFCIGGNVVLDATSPAATDTYEWFLNGVLIPGATNPTYTATTTGNYKVRVTNVLTCQNTSRQKQVLALDGPTILPAGPISACTGGSLLLSANTGGGYGGLGFQWKRNGITIPGATNSSYAVTNSGNYSVVVRVISDPTCTFNVPPTVVSIFPVPTPAISNTGGTFSTPNLYSNYQWYLNSVAIPGATSYVYTPVTNGSYNLRITDYNGCSNYSNTLVIGSAGVQQVGNIAVSIYPNPATKIVKIDASVPVHAVICGMEGKTIIDKEDAAEMDISQLPVGMYLIYVYGEKGEKLAVQKLIKQ
jgi:hypothetical protein